MSAKELRDLVESGAVPPQHRVTCESLNGQWVTARDVSEAYAKSLQFSASGAGERSGFIPPPRPELKERPQAERDAQTRDELALDPALSLFDALQAAKEKKNRLKNSEAENFRPDQTPGRAFKPQIAPHYWIYPSVIILFGSLYWGINHALNSKDVPPVAAKSATGLSTERAAPVETIRADVASTVTAPPRPAPVSRPAQPIPTARLLTRPGPAAPLHREVRRETDARELRERDEPDPRDERDRQEREPSRGDEAGLGTSQPNTPAPAPLGDPEGPDHLRPPVE